MSDPITTQEAHIRLVNILDAHNIPGRRETTAYLLGQYEKTMPSLNALWNISFGVEASLSVTFRPDFSDKDGEKTVMKVFVNWPGCGHSPMAAVVAAQLHAKLAQLACYIEVAFQDETVVWEPTVTSYFPKVP